MAARTKVHLSVAKSINKSSTLSSQLGTFLWNLTVDYIRRFFNLINYHPTQKWHMHIMVDTLLIAPGCPQHLVPLWTVMMHLVSTVFSQLLHTIPINCPIVGHNIDGRTTVCCSTCSIKTQFIAFQKKRWCISSILWPSKSWVGCEEGQSQL